MLCERERNSVSADLKRLQVSGLTPQAQGSLSPSSQLQARDARGRWLGDTAVPFLAFVLFLSLRWQGPRVSGLVWEAGRGLEGFGPLLREEGAKLSETVRPPCRVCWSRVGWGASK